MGALLSGSPTDLIVGPGTWLGMLTLVRMMIFDAKRAKIIIFLLCVFSYFLSSIYCKTLDMDWLFPDVGVRVHLTRSNIPHFSDSFTFDSRLHTRQGNGAAEGLKFALIKLPARNNNSDFWFNPISIFHITGFSAGIILSSKHFNLFFWKFFWFVLIFWFLSCVKLLIIDGWARATHTHYAKW